MVGLRGMEKVADGCREGGEQVAYSLDPQKDTTINLPDKQEGKGEYCLDCCQLSSGIRWSLIDFEFMFVMHNFVMS